MANKREKRKSSNASTAPVSLEFTEEMKGYITLSPKSSYQDSYSAGKKEKNYIMFHLTIRIADVAFFVYDPTEKGTAIGWVDCASLGGRLEVVKGDFNCFVDKGAPSENVKNMQYRLFLKNRKGAEYTLSGHKVVKDDGILNIWNDTSTLYTRIFDGFVIEKSELKTEKIAEGILHIHELDFIKQMTTFRSNGKTFEDRKNAFLQFGELFAGNLWEVYAVHWGKAEPELWREREIPLFTLDGVKNAEITTHYVSTEDKLSLSLLRFKKKESKDVVILMHGLTTSSDMFIMPEHKNIVTYLHEHGFNDVWSFDWRGSLRSNYNLSPHRYNLDDIALYDVPAALHKVRENVGNDKRIHFIVHCVGSISFFMSFFAKKIDGITSVTSNSVSITPNVALWSKVKLILAPFLIENVFRFPNVNPRWSYLPGPARGKFFSKFISLFHNECDNPACHMLSLMWGTGWPACYEHANLPSVTHRRVGDLFGATSMNYHRHIRKAVFRKVVVKYKVRETRYDSLPNNYLEYASDIKTPILFITGDKNKVFKNSNIVAYETLKRLRPDNRNELFIAKGYGHQDTLMGKNSERDVFPKIIEFLKKCSRR
ncbi:ab-hydrolase associated lipase region [Leptospira inadai serovar Lyme str. 10]|uniref:Ab-hydrolase associated lipase region n=2 Tax=Leptospira inadai serovar Lyme TaxID=293084 RepID=V6HCJ2_9LEPT|nr:alpha/beta fold hydrolase [Leptospira inadai]EQA37347.1 ab-hydrolase associated lipase region [Leptospira inadai serovar Lyme str. 10]PNV74783.1 alpha/beta hydrolase [Leptospira inadai serovar Lyme]